MTDRRDRDITVVICSYEHASFLERALDSVRAQSLAPSQLIVTDDASRDGSPRVIERWLARHWPDADFIENELNIGFPATLNKVIPLVRGDLLVIMAADDWMTPDRIERQSEILAEADESVGMVYSDMIEVDVEGRPTGQRWFDMDRMGPPAAGDLFPLMIRRAFMAAPTVMVRTKLLHAAGPYDESLVAEDYDMFLRLSRCASWEYIPDPLVYYRVHGSSLSRSKEFLMKQRSGRIRMLRKHVGVSAGTDVVIAERTARMAESLYKEGRSPRRTASDLRFALSVRFVPKVALLWLVATARVPGPLLVRVARLARRPFPRPLARHRRLRSDAPGRSL